MSQLIKTPDGRYIVIQGRLGPRLWRASNPDLSESERLAHVGRLMTARRALAKPQLAAADRAAARRRVQQAKEALGERGPVWWNDGAPDFNRRLIANTPYAEWWTDRPAET